MAYPCPCCRYNTFDEEPNGTYIICPVCYWEAEDFKFHDDIGVNGLTLKEAQHNFVKYRAVKKEFIAFVRAPSAEEKNEAKE